ncbi:hypothetical protein GCM10010339_15940 [Streptomyces alanosinicus]|uniref:Response regulatory domain-containing protein n=1 Tax=Streptomyces alanosinicus TaxID=68171 RepID=A0A918YEV5_9ACTN|nr:hypothetical protein GCM10010339_15940 [Streptomyces alanosinicus]
MVRGSFRVLVDHTPGMTAVGEAANGADAVELARRGRPDVVLMDVRMPDLDGIEATRQICSDPALPGVRVLILTTFDLDEYVYAALRAGAAGEALLAPSVTRRLIAEFGRRPEPARPPSRSLDGVTDRERETGLVGDRGRGVRRSQGAVDPHFLLYRAGCPVSRCGSVRP